MNWTDLILDLRESNLPKSVDAVEAAIREQVRGAAEQIRAGNTVSIDPEPMQRAFRRIIVPSFGDGFDSAVRFYGKGEKAGLLTGEEELLRYLQSFGAVKVKVVNETTRRLILEEIVRGLDEGLDVMGIADRILARWLIEAPQDGPVSLARTENIARTEIGAALNAGSLAGAADVGMTHKTWSSVQDFRTRRPDQRGYDHYSNYDPQTGRGANGQTRRIHEPFVISGEQLMFPGDASLGASVANLASCRCASTFSFRRD